MTDTAINQEVAAAPESAPLTEGSNPVLSMIERVATDPNADVDKLERMLAMQERILDREAEAAFNVAMQEAQEEMPRIMRDAKNDSTHSTYARLETIMAKINPVITKRGFSMSFGTADSPLERHYRIVCTVSHTAGHSREYHADVPADMTGMKGNQNKTATHGFGSTMSYGRRYLTLLIFNIALTNEDDDGNRAGATPISDETKEEIIELLKETNTDIKKALEAFYGANGPKSLDELTMRFPFPYGALVNGLREKKKKMEASNEGA